MKLPLKYTETMKALLGEEYDAYLASFDEERFYGLRVNTLKLSAEEMAARGVFSLRPVPWCETGFYYDVANALPSIRITMQGCIICRSQVP